MANKGKWPEHEELVEKLGERRVVHFAHAVCPNVQINGDDRLPIPDYKEFAVPFLHLLEEDAPRSFNRIVDCLVVHFKLSEADRSERVKCGRQFTYRNRIIVARTFLLKAGYIQVNKERELVLTEAGRTYLKEGTIQCTKS